MPKQKRKRRTRLEILRDRSRISELHIKGRLQWEIAQELGLTQPTISKELAKASQEWKRQCVVNIEQAKAEEKAKIDTVERQAWSAWTRSIAVDTVGNPRFMKVIQDCIAKRCDLLGLNDPQKQEHSGQIQIYKLPEPCDTIEEWEELAAVIAKKDKVA